jgi:hypothetical protein
MLHLWANTKVQNTGPCLQAHYSSLGPAHGLVQNIHHTGVYLNAEQQQEINVEMKKLAELSNKGYRTGKFWTDTNIPNDTFMSILDEVVSTCPLITSVVECLVVSNKQDRNVHKTVQAAVC